MMVASFINNSLQIDIGKNRLHEAFRTLVPQTLKKIGKKMEALAAQCFMNIANQLVEMLWIINEIKVFRING